jgi:hypothetical protein
MGNEREKWDCLFVNRVTSDNRIYLTNPQEYGVMYVSLPIGDKPRKVRNSIPIDCGPIRGSANEDKLLKAIAISIALNKEQLLKSNGLVVRGFIGGTPFSTPDAWIINSPGIGLHLKGTTGWIAYVSPFLRVHTISKGRYKGNELRAQQAHAIKGCVEYIERSIGDNRCVLAVSNIYGTNR